MKDPHETVILNADQAAITSNGGSTEDQIRELADADSDREPIELLAAEFVDRVRAGEQVTIDAYAVSHPELADEIRELFPAIIAMERLKLTKEPDSSGSPSLGTLNLDQLGDFHIVREIGRGGMGIVFEAEQESLGRRVAVKVLPRQSLLDSKDLQRFQREAQTAAKLHHTNIVPVFGVGEQDGYHYYVMQYIDGTGLDEFIKSRDGHSSDTVSEVAPTESLEAPSSTVSVASDRPRPNCQEVAEIGVQAAKALEYAHSQGTLHRDIKPANLILDRLGVVWVADFGLAKAMEHDDLSHSGNVVGTLRYMAPEQLRGETDVRSDLYSLGLTLYELLTLQPAHADSNRSALLHQVTQAEPIRPSKLNPVIPFDLETIVLKTIAREPDHRYQTAGELCSDLQCFLDDRPISARRISSFGRLWRWCRRNRAVATLSSTAIALLVLVAAMAIGDYIQTRKANKLIKAALGGEKKQREKAEATSDVAVAALDEIFEQFSPNRIAAVTELTVDGSQDAEIQVPIQPVLSNEAAALLEHLVKSYGQLAVLQDSDDAKYREKAAKAERRVGDIRSRLGQYDQALLAYQRAIKIYSDLGKATTASGFETELAATHNEIGNVYRETQQFEQSRASHLRAAAMLNSVVAKYFNSAPRLFELARTYYFLGSHQTVLAAVSPGRGGPGGGPSGPRFGSGGPGGPRLGGGGPGRRRERPPNGNRSPRGENGARNGNRSFGENSSRGGPSRRREGSLDGGNDSDGRSFFRRDGRPPGGDRPGRSFGRDMQYLQKATEILDQLVQHYPSVPDYRRLQAICYRDMHPRFGLRNEERSEPPLEKAIAILEELVDEFPEVTDYRFALVETYTRWNFRGPFLFGDSATITGKRLRDALVSAEKLVAEHPNVPDFAASRVHIYFQLGQLHHRSRKHSEAEQAYRTALKLQSALRERFSQATTYDLWQAVIQQSLARLLRGQNRFEESRELVENSIDNLRRILDSNPEARYVHEPLVHAYWNLAEVLRRLGKPDEAARYEDMAEAQRRLRGRSGPGRPQNPVEPPNQKRKPREGSPPRNGST